jgi:hypothetical protein
LADVAALREADAARGSEKGIDEDLES